MVKNLFAVAAFAAMLPMGAAQGQPVVQSQEGIALENQILQLQQQVQQMQSGGGGGGSSLGNVPAPAPASATSAEDPGIAVMVAYSADTRAATRARLGGAGGRGARVRS